MIYWNIALTLVVAWNLYATIALLIATKITLETINKLLKSFSETK